MIETQDDIKLIGESVKCMINSFNDVINNNGNPKYIKMLAYAMININTTVNIIKETEEDLKKVLLLEILK